MSSSAELESRRLLGKAREDQVVLVKLSPDGEVADAVLGFHAQQAVEKGLKAVLAARGEAVPKTHDLTFLLQLLCEGPRESPPEEVSAASVLSPWAVEYRYGEVPGDDLDRIVASTLVAAVLDWAAAELHGPENR